MSAVLGELRTGRAMIAQGWTQKMWAAAKDPCGLQREGIRDAYTQIARLRPSEFCYCATGPLVVMNASDESYMALEAALPVTPDSTLRGPMRDVQIWNDKPGRTKDEVLALYDRAIAAVQAAEPCDGPKDGPELTVVQ